MKRLAKLLKKGPGDNNEAVESDGGDFDDDDDDDEQSDKSAGSARMTKEMVLGTTAGFTDQVQGCKFEQDDMEAAYNKVVKDWNMDKHNGFNVQHGHGTWGIYQNSATEYKSYYEKNYCLILSLIKTLVHENFLNLRSVDTNWMQ